MLPEPNRWFALADEDLRMARLALGEHIHNQVCFHAQQAVEKLLKGLLSEQNRAVPKTHRLTDLLTELHAPKLKPLREAITLLDRFYIPTRYPDALPGLLPDGLPGEEDAARALQTVIELTNWIAAR